VHAQTGPIVGVSSKHGAVVGWEAGAGLGVLSGSFGAEVRPFGERTASFYFAGEPSGAIPTEYRGSADFPTTFIGFGGTAGYSVDDSGEGAALFGGFGGVSRITSGDCRDTRSPSFSVMFGVHVFLHDSVELTFYGSPKLGFVMDCPDLRTGAFRYH
jgi:hypothetical protein